MDKIQGPRRTHSSANENLIDLRGQWDPDNGNDESNPAPVPRRYSHIFHDSLLNTLLRLRSRDPEALEELQPLLQQAPTGPEALVEFDGKDDQYNPLNWTFRHKCATTALYGLTTAGITFSSSVYSTGTSQISQAFGVRPEIATLGTRCVGKIVRRLRLSLMMR